VRSRIGVQDTGVTAWNDVIVLAIGRVRCQSRWSALVNAHVFTDRSEEIRVVKAIDVDALADAMFQAVRAESPYSQLPAHVLEEVREHCRHQAFATLGSLEAGAAPSEVDLAFVRDLAARRAQQRVPLTALLHAYRVGYAVVWDRVRAEVQRSGVSVETGIALADHCVAYINTISFAATDGYLAEQQRLLGDKERSRSWLLEMLLQGERPSGDAELLLSALRLDARGHVHVVVVGASADDDPSTEAELAPKLAGAMQQIVAASGDAPVLWGVLNDRTVAVVVRPELTPLDPWLEAMRSAVAATLPDAQLAVGVSTAWGDLADVPRAYKEAMQAITLTRSDRRFVALSQTSLFDGLIALADATTYRLIPSWANALIEEDRRASGELSSTLSAYVQCELSVGRAASTLEVHPNTIRYRLHRIESITGGTLRSYTHLFDILASMRLLSRRRA
jgi:sugar diacid utilization regulator